MFVGRERELATLEALYRREGFQMAVVYGRRRVGKTALLDHFAEGKRALYFTARQQSSRANLRDFSRLIHAFFGLPDVTPPFASWLDALTYVARESSRLDGPLLFVFDEFPYAAETERALPSTVQVAIDHEFLKTNACMILCGSNEGFMEGEVMGRKSPLYGRRNAQIRLLPFDYADAALMLPGLAPEEQVRYYATFGGTPYYLAQVDLGQTYEQNVERLMFSMYGLLYEEPLMLLRQELREPALYNSVLGAVGGGATRPKSIAEQSGVEYASAGKYLKTLADLGILVHEVPFGENEERSRKGVWRIRDPFFAYWYRFVSPNAGFIESGAGAQVARRTAFGDALSTYVGFQFESVCRQWLVRRNSLGELPFLASSFGRWWGTDPAAREEVDVDVIAADKPSGSILLGECKWRNSFDETEALSRLEARAALVRGYERRHYALFTKRPLSAGTRKKLAARSDVLVVDAGGLYEDA